MKNILGSKKLLGTIFLGSALLFSNLVGPISPASAAVPEPDDVFSFDNTLTSSTSSTTLSPYSTCSGSPTSPCNSSTGFGVSGGDSYWEWTSTSNKYGGGLVYNPSANIGTTYTFFLKFQITTPSTGGSYNKVIDYNDLQDDDGFYLSEDGGDWFIQFYPLDTGDTPYAVTQLLDLAVVRDGSTTPPTFTVYTRASTGAFTQEYQVSDSAGLAIPYLANGNTLLGFFGEDGNSTEAILSGKVFDLRFWYDTALTQAQLNEQFAGIYTVSYDSNGATAGSIPPSTTAAGAQVVSGNVGALEKSGFVFSGWNTLPSGQGVTYSPGSSISSANSLTLYAIWTPVLPETAGIQTSSVLIFSSAVLLLLGSALLVTLRRNRIERI